MKSVLNLPFFAKTAAAILLALPTTSLYSQPSATPGLFRQPKLAIHEGDKQDGAGSSSRPVLSKSSSSTSQEDLEEKQETLAREVDYAKSKLDAAQKRLAIQSAAGDAEQVDRLNTEVKDWEARLKSSKEELALVQDELSKSKPNNLTDGGSTQEQVLPGENLEIFVNEDASFNGRYQVRRGGYIILPQVGRITVAGKTLSQCEQAVKRALESSQLTRATVLIERIGGTDVESGPLIFLSGAFRSPRPYRIPLGTAPTLVSVILSCGGVRENADLTRVKIMRMAGGKSVVEEVNVQKILDGGGLTSDISLAEGDVVTIPAGPSSLIYITGNVKRQGSYDFVDGEHLAAYGAILRAGGLARFADEKNAHILRPMPDGTKRKIPVNLVDIKKGKRADVPLEANDIIVVPEKWFSF